MPIRKSRFEIGTDRRCTYHATILGDEERQRIWNLRISEMPSFADLQSKAGDHVIPIIRLDPLPE